jgi:hypothetical protein
MIDIVTICTYDARKIAAELVRLLEAEQHQVRLIFGRQSQHELEEVKAAKNAVLIIWSADAPGSSYFLEWARQIDAGRLVEIATAPGWPMRADRKAPVVDFSGWRGERGGRAWNALNERLRAVSRVMDPPKPPAKHAALALSIVSVAAVGVALGVRADQAPQLTPHAPETTELQTAQLEAPTVAVGGATYDLEPGSIEDLSAIPNVRPLRMPLYDGPEPLELARLDSGPLPAVRDPTLMERIRDIPLFGANNSDSDHGS